MYRQGLDMCTDAEAQKNMAPIEAANKTADSAARKAVESAAKKAAEEAAKKPLQPLLPSLPHIY